LVQKSAHQHDTVVENSRLRQENERVVTFPTFTDNKKETEVLDLHSMTEEELKMLQEQGKEPRLVLVVAFSSLKSDDRLS
jgi:hypothetical protein